MNYGTFQTEFKTLFKMVFLVDGQERIPEGLSLDTNKICIGYIYIDQSKIGRKGNFLAFL